MLKLILKLIVTTIILLSTLVNAQSFQGKATYQTNRNVNLQMDSTMIDNVQQKMMQEQIRKQFERTYILTFDKTTSVYKQEEKLDKPVAQSGFGIVISGDTSTLFKDTKEKTFVQSEDSFGKEFLITDKLPELKWNMEKETKMIGKYLCMKATAIKMVDDYDKIKREKKEKQKEMEITAWYAPEIPVAHGPDVYFGLPGLILELHEDKMHYVCSKLVLNPKEKIEIKAPNKGEKISQKDFEKMMDEKMKDMMENFKGGRKKGKKGNTRVISIQG